MRAFALCLGLLLSSCSSELSEPPGETAVAGRPTVYTVNYPLAWLAQQLAADSVDIEFPAPGNEDPAFWKPSPEVIARYQQADLVLLNGASYARWLSRATLPASRLLDTSQKFSDQLISVDSGPAHSHGPQGEHSHGEQAFTVWLDPTLFAQQAQVVAQSLTALLPAEREAINTRLRVVEDTLANWDVQLDAASKALAGRPVLYSHPVYQYLQRRYSLNGIALHWEPDQAPAPQDWLELERLLQQHPATIMLWEAPPLTETQETLQRMGITTVVYAPQGASPGSGDFAGIMAGNIDRLSKAAGVLSE